MQFNSWAYFLFLLPVLSLYYWLNNRLQKTLLLLTSYLFYSLWDWRLTSLLAFITLVVYVGGREIAAAQSESSRRGWLTISVGVSLAVLGAFKYFDFFSQNLQLLALSYDVHLDWVVLHLLVPVGLSFYTFQALTYPLDIYRGQLQPSRSVLDIALFVSFFPQLAAGPIERAKNILPQLERTRAFNLTEFEKGTWLIFWGLFKKVFVADNLAVLVNARFDHLTSLTAPVAYVVVIAYAFQIYCDFSSYTDMARGTAKLFGIRLMENFMFPYLATNPRDFWRRWHISLSTWLRDYVYIPLGGNRHGTARTNRNIIIVMVLCGFWHGAAWNYILWGLYQGLLLVAYDWACQRWEFRIQRGLSILAMFHFTLFGWFLFRSSKAVMVDGVWRDASMGQIAEVLSTLSWAISLDTTFWQLVSHTAFFILPLILVEAMMVSMKSKYILPQLPSYQTIPLRAALLFLIVIYGVQAGERFIYFQF